MAPNPIMGGTFVEQVSGNECNFYVTYHQTKSCPDGELMYYSEAPSTRIPSDSLGGNRYGTVKWREDISNEIQLASRGLNAEEKVKAGKRVVREMIDGTLPFNYDFDYENADDPEWPAQTYKRKGKGKTSEQGGKLKKTVKNKQSKTKGPAKKTPKTSTADDLDLSPSSDFTLDFQTSEDDDQLKGEQKATNAPENLKRKNEKGERAQRKRLKQKGMKATGSDRSTSDDDSKTVSVAPAAPSESVDEPSGKRKHPGVGTENTKSETRKTLNATSNSLPMTPESSAGASREPVQKSISTKSSRNAYDEDDDLLFGHMNLSTGADGKRYYTGLPGPPIYFPAPWVPSSIYLRDHPLPSDK